MLTSIVIHALLVLGFYYYTNIVSENGNKVTQAAGVNTVIGTRMNIKRIAVSKPPLPSVTAQVKVKAKPSTVKNLSKTASAAHVVKATSKVGFTKQKTPVEAVEKNTKKPVKQLEPLVDNNKNSVVEVAKLSPRIAKPPSKAIKTEINVDKAIKLTQKKAQKQIDKGSATEHTIITQKGVRHTGDNVDESKVSLGKSSEANTHWNKYKTAVFSAINAQKVYPKQAKLRRAEGTVVVKFDITKLGNISRFSLIQQVSSEHLNRSTKRLFEQLYLPERPASVVGYLPVTLTVPIEYSLN